MAIFYVYTSGAWTHQGKPVLKRDLLMTVEADTLAAARLLDEVVILGSQVKVLASSPLDLSQSPFYVYSTTETERLPGIYRYRHIGTAFVEAVEVATSLATREFGTGIVIYGNENWKVFRVDLNGWPAGFSVHAKTRAIAGTILALAVGAGHSYTLTDESNTI